MVQPLSFFWLILSLLPMVSIKAQFVVESPKEHMVFQRDSLNEARIMIECKVSAGTRQLEARLLLRKNEPGQAVDWQKIIDTSTDSSKIKGVIRAKGGRYDLEIRVLWNDNSLGDTVKVDKVGIGEVFLIVGHSNAQGQFEPDCGAKNDLVTVIDPHRNMAYFEKYDKTADPNYMTWDFSALCDTCGIGPFHRDAWLWGALGDRLAEKWKVPVLFYGAAFGGSSIKATYESAYLIPFVHPFIKYYLRMPFANIENVLKRYVPKTGLRAILSAHGVNDSNDSTDRFYFHYKKVIDATRHIAGIPNPTWVVAPSCYIAGKPVPRIIKAQERLVQTMPNVFKGAELNQIDTTGRRDGLHFNAKGLPWAARLWDEALTEEFLRKSKPIMAHE